MPFVGIRLAAHKREICSLFSVALMGPGLGPLGRPGMTVGVRRPPIRPLRAECPAKALRMAACE